VSDPEAAFEPWREGRFDFLLQPFLPTVDGLSDTTILRMPLLTLEFFAFGGRPPFGDARVRKALAHAVDRSLLMVGAEQRPAYGGFLPPAMPGHSHELAPTPDLALARSLLAEAGYPEGRGLPELRLVHADPGLGADARRKAEARFGPQWRDLGIRLRQEWVPFERIRTEVQKDHTFWSWAWASDYPEPQGMLETFLASQPVPVDDELSALLRTARSSRSRDERLEFYRAVDRRLVAEDAWIVPTVYDIWHVLHRPHVEGLWTHPLGMGTLDGVVVRQPT
jgi:oligopeptide transport system substrate-binding protein